ncbi:SseB family protein [Arthrobacter sp. GMC3]|uniref:SseB family protein n=1 Tax=Arthrobacter sp. GMC3 TaxID=2058894 RepID=UPI000CE48A63|nr:SseB family protein [Arthrobacter sp. GMC3]
MTDAPKKQLPAHIAAALAGAGGRTDSAGQPWSGRALPDGEKYHNFDEDDGAADPIFTEAVARLVAGSGAETDVVASLATIRVFIPIVAQLAEQTVGENGLVSDKESDMALVTVQAPDGRRALPVFTHSDALTRWHPEARPVAVYAARAALSAVAEEAQLLVLDPGSERPFVVRRPAMWALAQQQNWVPSYSDSTVAQVLRDSVTALGNPAVVDISAAAGQGIESLWDKKTEPSGRLVAGGGAGPELAVTITLLPGLDQPAVESILGALQNSWAGNEYFAQAVDSVKVRLRHPSPTT